MAQARRELALTREFKEDPAFVLKLEVKEDFWAHEGLVGPQWDFKANEFLPGGGNQIELGLATGDAKLRHLKVIERIDLH